MKNLLKFGFLGLALTFVMASCNSGTKTGETTDSLAKEVDHTTEHVADSLENVADSVRSTGDSISDSLKNVQ
ncbi:hypothetical protein [Sphingobacterium hungaricum]|uniref:Entericidin EcnA/B family protein n=1 Tax=Sphingobacterium hungaricum TaxID=2082723 RepID=A0A928UWK4_9SPHI|nr:hypothetical protein [Sphingobacterium hungaricum]MBE8712836.1 hypothetical protein [Sphingobacterium hungaricum]